LSFLSAGAERKAGHGLSFFSAGAERKVSIRPSTGSNTYIL
jgi:hypothetical protein